MFSSGFVVDLKFSKSERLSPLAIFLSAPLFLIVLTPVDWMARGLAHNCKYFNSLSFLLLPTVRSGHCQESEYF